MILQQMKARVVDRRRKSMSSHYRATYPTGVIGRYGASAMVLYGARFTAAGLAFTALWFDIRRNRLSRVREDDARIRSTTLRNLIGPVIYPLATALAFLAPRTSLGIFFGLAAFYFLPGLPRRKDGS
jgi:hypothetical protein